MTKQLIIAKYNENIDWLKNVNLDTIIYNKGKEFNLEEIRGQKNIIEEFKLPNIGRESHTLLFHIIKNYNNLPDVTVFLQANPFDHLGNLTDKYPNVELIDFLNNLPEFDNLFGFGIYHSDIGYIELRSKIFEELKIKDSKYGNTFSVGCQYIFPKNVILKKPLEFYKKIQSWHEDPNNGFLFHEHLPCIIERTWLDIFDSNDSNFTNI